MNYIREAYQYYRDLPPINAATLTGAIDVIVIERPADPPSPSPSSSGPSPPSTILGCTPFHVRFGKWQILRPAEKQVTVTVNGEVAPFLMKIGDAGEAFFVCETEEEGLPEELMTSPILEATKGEGEGGKVMVDVPDVGRFGVKEGEGREVEVERPDPPFLDLNTTTAPSASPSHSPNPSTSASTTPSPPETSITSPSPSPQPPVHHQRLDSGEVLAAPLRDPRGHAEKKVDEAVPPGEGEGAEGGPVVTYKHDVVLDMEGYHAHPDIAPNLGPSASDNDDNKQEEGRSLVQRVLGLVKDKLTDEEAPRPTEDDAEKEHAEERERDERRQDLARVALMGGRALSEPPALTPGEEFHGDVTGIEGAPMVETPEEEVEKEVATERPRGGIQHLRGITFSSTPALPHLTLSSLPSPLPSPPSQPTPTRPHPSLPSFPQPDYTWEWGSLPTPRAPLPSGGAQEEKERRLLGVGGKIYPKGKEGLEIGLEVEEGRTGFELSLCGERGLKGSEIEAAQAFTAQRVTYRRFIEDPSIVDSPDLVIKWAGDKYVTRADASPLFEALVAWKGEAAPVDFVDEAAREGERSERDKEAAKGDGEGEGGKAEMPTLSKTSSWSFWWRSGGGGSGSTTPTPSASAESVGRVTATATATTAAGTTRQEELGMVRRGASSPAAVGGGPGGGGGVVVDGQNAEVDKDHPSAETVTGAQAAQGVQGEKTRRAFAKTLRLTSDQLKMLHLKPGPNTVTFSLTTAKSVMCTARIFLWSSEDQLVVSDIDGTITKSDALGHVFTMIGRDWTHSGVAKLYTDICRNGYKIMYLTSRAIGQADSTRDYLKGIKQNDYQLPEGPVIMSPDRLMASLHREVIMRKPEVFKMACLRDIQRLFGDGRHPFYAGFGNRITDALSYRSVSIPSGRIFTIDSSGEVKMELLELAGYKSSYIHMTDLVDQMFPPVHRKWAPEFTDLNYWRTPFANIDIPDLRPPSPALSARSDSSTRLSRLRNFTLGLPAVTTRQASSASVPILTGAAAGTNGEAIVTGKPPRPTSPLIRPSVTAESLSEDEGADDRDFQLGSRSPTDSVSMPGSLPGSPDPGSWMRRSESEDEREEEDGAKREEEEEEGWDVEKGTVGDEAFDDELLATGEMENVPF